MMKILHIFITICVIGLSYQNNYFVLTKYNTEELEDYYEHLRKEFGSDYIRKQFKDEELKQSKLCHKLRKSKLFSVGNSTSVYSASPYIIRQSAIHAEYEQLIPSGLEIQTKEHNKKTVQKLPAFNCLDNKGKFDWIITRGFHENSYFMFSYGASFKFATARQTGLQRRPHPQLVALIDKQATEVQHYHRSFKNANLSYMKEILQYNPGTSDRDVLCDLHPLLQYRLCSLGGDFIKGNFVEILDSDDEYPHYGQFYLNIYSNLIHPMGNSTEDCQLPDIHHSFGFPPNTSFPRKFLSCSVVLYDPSATNIYRFYLGLDLLQPSTVYILFFDEILHQQNVKKISISWLDYMTQYIQALSNYQ